MDITYSPGMQNFSQEMAPQTPQTRTLVIVDGYNMSPAGQQGEEPSEEVPSPEQAESPDSGTKRKRREQKRANNQKVAAKRRQQVEWFAQKEAVEAAALEATRKHEDLLQQLQQAQELLKDSRRRERQQISRNLHEQQLQLSKQHHADMQKKEAASYRKGRAAAGADLKSELQQAEANLSKVIHAKNNLDREFCVLQEENKRIKHEYEHALLLRAAPLLPDPFDDIEGVMEGNW